jgi:predicted metal-dependent phosphoesterase TrpH
MDSPLSSLGSADLHLHTRASDGLQSAVSLLEHVEHNTDLDVIAITDHDEVSAALWARDEAARRNLRVQVIPGVEVSTRQGHLLGLFIEERPPAFRSYLESAEWIVSRGGLCVAPHPFARITPSVGRDALEMAVREGLVVGLETLNPSPAGRVSRTAALAFAAANPLAVVGSSDAHWRRIVGMGRTRFVGSTAQDLKHALLARTTIAEGRFARPLELAAEALPQTVWATAILPMRKMRRYVGDLRDARRLARAA